MLYIMINHIRVQRHAAAFHVFALAKTFHSSAFDMFAFHSLWQRRKISHDIVLPATIMLTYAGQALLRVRGGAMHLRADLDGGKYNLL